MRILKFRSLAGTSKEWTLDIIRSKSFYIPNFSELNDPFDSNFPFDLEDERHQRFLIKTMSEMEFDGGLALFLAAKGDQDYKSRILSWLSNNWELRRKLYRKLLPSGGVVSFSKKEEVLSHPLMWAHYADSHKGLCFELEISEDAKFVEIEYIKHLPKINLLNLDDEVRELFGKKGNMWSYEREVRFLTPDPEVRRFPFQGASLKAIYFGANSDWEDVELIQNLVLESGMTVEYGMMQPSATANALEAIPSPPVSEMLEAFRPTMKPNIDMVKKLTKDILFKVASES